MGSRPYRRPPRRPPESIKTQWSLGEDLGVEGTPAIFTQTGDYIGGFMTPDQLVQTIQDTQKAATAGAVR